MESSLVGKKDIRIQILVELDRMDHSHEQLPLNEFLSKRRTVVDTDDLGTVRRCLQELRGEGFIIETDEKANVIDCEEMKTRGVMPSAIRSCKLFVDDIVYEGTTYNKIPVIYLGITLKGKKFLADIEAMEYQKTIRKQEETIRGLSETNLKLSNLISGIKLAQIIILILTGAFSAFVGFLLNNVL